MRVKSFIVLVLSAFIISCANTKVIDNWVSAENNKKYSHLMIIGVSDSQQTRRVYEHHFVAELKKINVIATPSHELISSKQKMNRETVINAVQNTDIDAVLVTYLVSSDSVVKYHDSLLSQGYSGDVDSSKMSATLVSTRGRTSSSEVVTLKNDLYDRETRSLVWSVQTRTVAPESIDEVVTDVTELLINQLQADNVIK